MRATAILLLLVVPHLCPAEQQRELPEKAKYTFTAIALLVGEYYVAHHTWPTSTEQLHRYVMQLQPSSRSGEPDVFRAVWSCVRHLEFTPRGKDVLVSARFHSEEHDYSHTAVLHPGHSAEDIADHMTPK